MLLKARANHEVVEADEQKTPLHYASASGLTEVIGPLAPSSFRRESTSKHFKTKIKFNRSRIIHSLQRVCSAACCVHDSWISFINKPKPSNRSGGNIVFCMLVCAVHCSGLKAQNQA